MNHHSSLLIYERSSKGRVGYHLSPSECANVTLPASLLRREKALLPEVSELDVLRHFTLLSQKNFGIESAFYPLGSCTMKYNPKINDELATLPGFQMLHPLQPASTIQGFLSVYDETQAMLSEITGMDQCSLHPFAGAQGEHVGLMIMKAYHHERKDFKRRIIIVPDNAHGTNPASAAITGFDVVEIKSNEDGTVNLDALDQVLSDEVAGLMLTNPNTAGVFEKDIDIIAKRVHDVGGLLYYDGANLNAIVGLARPGDMGFDIVHLNLHKTFSTPHGGGGPGSGTVGVKSFLIPYLPNPHIVKTSSGYQFEDSPLSVGRIGHFYGNASVYLRAYIYMRTLGKEFMSSIGPNAVLNANYLKSSLQSYFNTPLKDYCMHEFVFDGLKDHPEVTTLDLAKRLLDYGMHAPTIYFPLIYKQAMMIEPTDTESKETLDQFVDVMKTIIEEAKKDPNFLKQAPYHTPVRRLDEAKAARQPILSYLDYLKIKTP